VSFRIDVYLLLQASDESSEQHIRVRAFLKRCAADSQVFCLAWLTVMSCLRMATHPRIFAHPLTPTQAARNIEALTSLPHCRVIGEQEGF
jgi:hypothetical protein